jgi:WD40 repeat protein
VGEDSGALRESGLERIDAVCDRFERDWQQAVAGGPRPCLEDCLAGATGAERAAVRRELVALEIHYLRRLGETPQAEEYRQRFPELDLAWLELELAAGTPRASSPLVAPSDTQGSHATIPPGIPPASPTVWPAVPGYEILGELGRGGMGVVYKARQVAANRLVALKMILAGSHAGLEDLDRFRTEAEAIARLQHANIVQIYEVGEHGGLPFFSLEFCPGGSLDKKLAGTPLPPPEAARLVETLARAVQAAHDRHVVHRDLKPANVLLGANDTPKITDFGLAKKLDGVGHTGTGAVLGTPSYMAPEQAGGKTKEIGPAADVYALGTILYELLTGRPPFRAATRLDTILQVLANEPVAVRRLQPKVPRDLETICHKCLEKEPKKRFASATNLAADLERFLKGEPIQARPVRRVERAVKWIKRRPAQAAMVGLVLLLVAAMVGGTAGWLYSVGLQAERDRADQLQNDFNYARSLILAQRELEAGHQGRATEILDCSHWNLRGWEWHFLAHTSKLIHTIEGRYIGQVCLSPDGRRLATVGIGEVWFWDSRTGKVLHPLQVHKGTVTKICFSPDGKRLAGAGTDETLREWDVESGQQLRVIREHTGTLLSVCFSPDGQRLASAGKDMTVRLWDVRTGQELLALPGHSAEVTSLCFTPDGSRLASGSADKSVRLWDARTGHRLRSFLGHTEGVNSVCFSSDGLRLASGGSDKTVRLWDTRTGKELVAFSGHTAGVAGVCFSPDGRRLASGSHDNSVRLWDAQGGQGICTLQSHKGSVLSVFFSHDAQHLISGGLDQTVRVWDVRTGQECRSFHGHTAGVNSVCFSPDGLQLASSASGKWGRDDGEVKVWDVRTGQATLTHHRLAATSVCFSPNGQHLASVALPFTKHGLRVWDLRSGKATLSLDGLGTLENISFSPDGKYLAGANTDPTGGDKTVRLWHAQTGQELRSLQTGGSRITVRPDVICFSPDGNYIAGGGGSGNNVQLWDVVTGRQLRQVWNRNSVTSICFSPDSRILAVAGGTTVVLSDVRSGRMLLGLEGHTDTILSICFSPDGLRLASAGKDRTVRLWNVRTGHELLALTGHSAEVTSVCYSPDGQLLASGSADKSVRLWDARNGQSLRFLIAPGYAGIYEVGFSRDFQRVVARANLPGPGLLAWSLETGQPMKRCTDPAPPANQLETTSPDGTIMIWVGGFRADDGRATRWINDERVHVLRQRDAEKARDDDLALGQEWHFQQALEGEKAKDWTAAAFHLSRLILAEKQIAGQPPPPRFLFSEEEILLQMAARAQSCKEKNPHYLGTLGAALYRAAKHKKAVELLEQAVKRETGRDSCWMPCFLAMAHHRLGLRQKARMWLSRAKKQATGASPAVRQLSGMLGCSAPQPLSLVLWLGVPPSLLTVPGAEQWAWQPRQFQEELRKEAEALLGGKAEPAR